MCHKKYTQSHRRTGGGRNIALKTTICPKNKQFALKLTFAVRSEWGLKPLVNLFYTVEFVYEVFVCNVSSPITLHFVRYRWNLLHAFQCTYNINSAITFFMQTVTSVGPNYALHYHKTNFKTFLTQPVS